jgi:thiamine-monophosphate kinase
VHFERRFSTPEDVGYRALAVNLSDLAAMGAAPRFALLSLAMPDTLLVEEVEQMVAGLGRLADQHRMSVVGGNLSRTSGPLVVDVTAVGEVKPRMALTRSGGRPGDAVYVSGSIGGAAAGLEMLRVEPGLGDATAASNPGAVCVRRYRRPDARVRLGVAMARGRAARAAMDLSDGLGDAAHQLAEASGCGIEIEADALPIEPAARAWWEAAGKDAVIHALSGGDDYELLFAVPRTWGGRLRHVRSRVTEPTLTRIGWLTKDREARVLRRDGRATPLPKGFEHF